MTHGLQIRYSTTELYRLSRGKSVPLYFPSVTVLFCDSFLDRIRKTLFAETPQLKLRKQVRSDSNAYLAVLETAVLPIKLLTNNRHQTVSTYVFRAVRGTMEFSLSAR